MNNSETKIKTNKNGHLRGLHISIINHISGKLELAQAFDTYKSSTELDLMIDNKAVVPGHIVIAACKDDCVTNLSEKAKKWF